MMVGGETTADNTSSVQNPIRHKPTNHFHVTCALYDATGTPTASFTTDLKLSSTKTRTCQVVS